MMVIIVVGFPNDHQLKALTCPTMNTRRLIAEMFAKSIRFFPYSGQGPCQQVLGCSSCSLPSSPPILGPVRTGPCTGIILRQLPNDMSPRWPADVII